MTLVLTYNDDTELSPNNTFYPQFRYYDGTYYYTNVSVKLTPNRRKDTVIWLDKYQNFAPTSGLYEGFSYYNSDEKKMYKYRNSAWVEYPMIVGAYYCSYNHDGNSYIWNGSSLELYSMIYPTYVYNMLVFTLVGYGDTMPSYDKYDEDDWFYYTTDGYLYRNTGSAWRKTVYFSRIEYQHYLVALDNPDGSTFEVYEMYHDGTRHTLERYFNLIRVYISDGTYLQEFISAIADTGQTYSSEWKLKTETKYDKGTKFEINVMYLRDKEDSSGDFCPAYNLSGDRTKYNTEVMTTAEIQGRVGTMGTPSFAISSDPIDYYLTDDEIEFSYELVPTDSTPASILRPYGESTGFPNYNEYESKYGVYYILQWKDGSSYISTTLNTAISSGYVTRVKGTSDYNESVAKLVFKNPGEYTLYANAYYWRDTYKTQISKSISFTVYSYPHPTVAIKSITPYEYMEGHPDEPLYGIPPYVVVVEDTSKTTDPDQIPQKSLSLNFGDEGSEGNAVYLENSGTTLITLPDQTHTYNAYGPYTITLSYEDKRGNTGSGTTTFAPKKEPRIIKPPEITYSPTSMLQPVLAKGQAYVGGDPAPTVTWTYSTTDYSGSKEGEYVELSLLKAGDYTIKCEPEGLTSTTWTPTVVAREDVPDDSQDMEDFALVVLDENKIPIDYCKQHSSMQYIEYYQDTDTFSFTIPQTYEYAKYMQEGDLVIVGYKGKARLVEITCRSLSDGVISISGESAFPQRIAITATKSSASEGYDTQTYYGEDLIRYWLWTALTDPYPTATSEQPRGANIVVFDTTRNRGGTITYSARFDTLIDIIKSICQSCNLGFTTKMRKLSDKVTTFDCAGLTVTRGIDRTYTSGGENAVIFSPEQLKNCRVISDSGATGHNVAVAGDYHIGSYRKFNHYGSTSLTGYQRKELFVDGSTAADDDELQRMAELALIEEKQLSIKIQVLPSCQWVFGTNYDVGDVVTVITQDRGQKDLQIYSAETVRRANGDELYLNLGYESHTAPSLIRKTRNENTYARK